MSGTVSTRWFWSDWMSDPGLRACSYAARGLWKDLLCIAGGNKAEYGFVSLNGHKLTDAQLARMANGTESEVVELLGELEVNGVFSRDRRGIIYCRRMVRAEKNRSNGRLGGNPNLLKTKENKKSVQPDPKPLIPEPEPKPDSRRKNTPAGAGLREDDYPPDAFDRFWSLYPPGRKGARKATAAKFDGIRRRGEVTFERLMDGLQRFVDSRPDPQYTKAPEVWLNKGCWDDEYLKSNGVTGYGKTTNALGGFSGLGARLRQAISDDEGPDFGESSAGVESHYRR